MIRINLLIRYSYKNIITNYWKLFRRVDKVRISLIEAKNMRHTKNKKHHFLSTCQTKIKTADFVLSLYEVSPINLKL